MFGVFTTLHGLVARSGYSVNLVWVLVVLAVIALIVFIFRR